MGASVLQVLNIFTNHTQTTIFSTFAFPAFMLLSSLQPILECLPKENPYFQRHLALPNFLYEPAINPPIVRNLYRDLL
jgi:hypothetical protein